MLQLSRPLAFLDLEATGLSITLDRIVEISVLKIKTDGQQITLTQRINPEINIPDEVVKIHGIRNEDVTEMPTFKQFASRLKDFLTDCDFAGYNSNQFDIPMLMEEFLRADIDFEMKGRKSVDVQNIFFMNEPRDLKAALRFYCGKDLENAHSAEADATATYEILMGQIERYEHVKGDVSFLHKYSSRQLKQADFAGKIVFNDKNQEVFNFGKYKGQVVEEVLAKEPGFYDWFMNGDFPRYSKKILTGIRLRKINSMG